MGSHLPFPTVVIHSVLCKHLNVYDLCRLMHVSKSCFLTFIHENAFHWIKQRILQRIPEFSILFDARPWSCGARTTSLKESKTKKRKKVWVMPRGGTWYLIKAYFRHLWSIEGLVRLSHIKEIYSEPLLLGGLAFAFEIENGQIVRKEYLQQISYSHFQCHYLYKDSILVSIALGRSEPGLFIAAEENVLAQLAQGFGKLLFYRGDWTPYFSAIFQFLRMKQLIMGEPVREYYGVLKNVVNQ